MGESTRNEPAQELDRYEPPTISDLGALVELTRNPPGKPVMGASDHVYGNSPFLS